MLDGLNSCILILPYVDYRAAKVYFEKSMLEHRIPEVKTIISWLDKKIEEEMKACIDPTKAEEAKEKNSSTKVI